MLCCSSFPLGATYGLIFGTLGMSRRSPLPLHQTAMDFSVSSHGLLLNSPSSPSYISNSISKSLYPSNPSRNSLLLFSTKRGHISTRPTSTCSMEPSSLLFPGAPRKKCEAIRAFENGGALTPSIIGRIGEVKRVTKETNVFVKVNLDGCGLADNNTGIPFLDHMLDQLASHGLFDVHVKASGDYHIDDHHTNEDVALALGTALLQALGDRKGIHRFGDFSAPLDEALIHVSLDLSGRPHLSFDLQMPTERVGTYDTQLVEHFFQSLVNTSGMTLHIRQLAGKNSHHIIEATFKAFARALRHATESDSRRQGSVPSSKGVLSRT